MKAQFFEKIIRYFQIFVSVAMNSDFNKQVWIKNMKKPFCSFYWFLLIRHASEISLDFLFGKFHPHLAWRNLRFKFEPIVEQCLSRFWLGVSLGTIWLANFLHMTWVVLLGLWKSINQLISVWWLSALHSSPIKKSYRTH